MKFKLLSWLAAVVSLLFLIVGCQQDPVLPSEINSSLPEITKISSDATRTLAGDSIQVSVEANNGTQYSWSADGGSFVDAKSKTTKWIAPQKNGNYKVVCTVGNSAGSNNASMILASVVVTLPQGVSAWWTFDQDFSEYVSGSKGNGGDSVSIEQNDAIQGLSAASFQAADPGVVSAIQYSDITKMKMGPSDDFTITMWIKTTDDQGWLIGRAFGPNDYSFHGKGLLVDGGALGVDCWGINGIDSNDPVNDGQWHNVAEVKLATDSVILYIDGNNEGAMRFGDWSTDSTTATIIGAANEEPGEGWPGTYQGLMDDIRFYPKALTSDEIAAIAANKP